MNPLLLTSQNILQQISNLLNQLKEEEYARPLDLLSKNSIGKHVRHIIEFYVCLFEGIDDNRVNYDNRSRDQLFEQSITYTQEKIQQYCSWIGKIEDDKVLSLEVLLNPEGDTMNVPSTLYRELVYNMEHAIHHMAILKIAIKECFHNIQVDEDFGIAYSTVKFSRGQ